LEVIMIREANNVVPPRSARRRKVSRSATQRAPKEWIPASEAAHRYSDELGGEKLAEDRFAEWIQAVAWTPNFSKLVVHNSGNRDSGTWYLVDIAAKRADPIGDDRPTLGAAAVGPVSIVEYRAADALAMNGVLTLPPGRDSKTYPS
jgi:dipeptidyl aminopeptidase/acylaminoacyl peptidase